MTTRRSTGGNSVADYRGNIGKSAKHLGWGSWAVRWEDRRVGCRGIGLALAVILTEGMILWAHRDGGEGRKHYEGWVDGKGTTHCLQSGRFLDSASESTVAEGNHRMTRLSLRHCWKGCLQRLYRGQCR
jgi:hypothetical protein